MEVFELKPVENVDSDFSDLQLKALSGLVAGKRNDEVASEIGISLGTLWNWKCQPKFKDELRRLQEVCFQDCINALRGASLEAALTLVEVMRDPDNSPKDRLAAAKAILAQVKLDPSNEAVLDPTTQIVRILEDMNK